LQHAQSLVGGPGKIARRHYIKCAAYLLEIKRNALFLKMQKAMKYPTGNVSKKVLKLALG